MPFGAATMGRCGAPASPGDPSIDLREERPIRVGGTRGRLVVADATRDGRLRASVAVAFSMGRGGAGHLPAAILPPGEWSSEESDFLRVVASSRAEVPPGLRTFPVTVGSA